MRASWARAAALWLLTAAAGIAILVGAEPAARPRLFALALAGAVVLTFAVQLATADRKGFVVRLIISTTGALGVLALASLAGLAVP